MTSRAQRFLQSIRKEIPDAVEGQGHDDAEVAAISRRWAQASRRSFRSRSARWSAGVSSRR